MLIKKPRNVKDIPSVLLFILHSRLPLLTRQKPITRGEREPVGGPRATVARVNKCLHFSPARAPSDRGATVARYSNCLHFNNERNWALHCTTKEGELPVIPGICKRRPRKTHPPEVRLAKQVSNSHAPDDEAAKRAREMGLRAKPRPAEGSCGRLLDVILAHLTRRDDETWEFHGAVRTAADVAGVAHRQAVRCIRRFVENGLLTPVEEQQGRSPVGRPKVYRVNL